MRTLAILQGIFYFATGVWPILSIRTFQMVTGPKTDLWLVKTVGALIAVIGLFLTAAGLHDRVTSEIVWLAAGSAAALMIVDVNYFLKGVISKIYLLDAVVESVLIVLWVAAAAS